ncbi:MAG: phosphoglycerate mutase, partial [Nitrospirae bacterium]
DNYLPKGENEEVLRELIIASQKILKDHKVNKKRMERGLLPANSIWLWGEGKRPLLPNFKNKYGIEGALISAVDLTKGIGIYAGLKIIEVPGATGYTDTNYEGKAEAALDILKSVDFVYLHVEAPDEAGHSGDVREKIRAIEDFDKRVVGNIMEGMKDFVDYKILLLPDHPTPIKLRTHTSDPVPYAIFSTDIKKEPRNIGFDEYLSNAPDARYIDKGYELMDYFIL